MPQVKLANGKTKHFAYTEKGREAAKKAKKRALLAPKKKK